MRVEEIRPGVFKLEITVHELSVLLAGARMSQSLIEANPDRMSGEGRDALRTVLGDFDAALKRNRRPDAEEQAP